VRSLFEKLPRLPLWAAAIGVAMFGSVASAATVTLHEAEMDAIFSQASFGANAIDIRYLATQTRVAPDLLDVSSVDITEFTNLVPFNAFAPTVVMAFIDSFDGNQFKLCSGSGSGCRFARA
jgi:hypothetical protein